MHTDGPLENTAKCNRPDDTPKMARRRNRDMRVISQMVAMHCKGCHDPESRTETSHCGDRVCPECLELDSYAVQRTFDCRNIATKKTCEECGNHCYSREMRERILEAMRWSGPRMAFTHPISAIRHLFGW